jgi:hypothetical protein
MLQTYESLKDELKDLLIDKNEKIEFIKQNYITQDTFEIKIPKYVLLELLIDYEYILQNIANIVNKEPQQILTQDLYNSNNYPNDDNHNIIEIAKDLNLQFDYTQYANILNNKEDAKKSDFYNFNDLDKESETYIEPQHISIKQGLRHKIKSGLKSSEFKSIKIFIKRKVNYLEP